MAQLLRRHAARLHHCLARVTLTAAGAAVAAVAVAVAAAGWGWHWAWPWERAASAHPRISTTLTWHADIEPLFARHCASCHTQAASEAAVGATAPSPSLSSIPLATYVEVRPWARAIRESVLERHMPPPRGRPGVDAGVDDHPLSPMERDLIVAWIDGGMPAGRAGASPAATFWCVMHPEVRADKAGACPLCGMPLSAFTPDLTRRYGWSFSPSQFAFDPSRVASQLASARSRLARQPDAAQSQPTSQPASARSQLASPRVAARGQARGAKPRIARAHPVTFAITETTTGARVRDFERVHEYPLHLFIVSEDFRSFEHVHPALTLNSTQRVRDGMWSFAWRPAAPGRYWFYGDFLPTGGAPQMLQRAIAVGTRTPAAAAPAAAANTRPPASDRDVTLANSSGIDATLTLPSPRSGDEHRLVITLRDAATRTPITDLQPYLGAWGHLFALHEGREEALHAHPDSVDTNAGGPAIAFDVLFPRAGVYYLWTQIQRRGTIITLPFAVHVNRRE